MATKPFIHLGTSVRPDGTAFPVLCDEHGCRVARTAHAALTLATKHAMEHGVDPLAALVQTEQFRIMWHNEHDLDLMFKKQQKERLGR